MTDVHILTATSVNDDDGVSRHLSFCNEKYEYGTHRDSYVIGNYSGCRGATCDACLRVYADRYPAAMRSDVAILDSVGKHSEANRVAAYLREPV